MSLYSISVSTKQFVIASSSRCNDSCPALSLLRFVVGITTEMAKAWCLYIHADAPLSFANCRERQGFRAFLGRLIFALLPSTSTSTTAAATAAAAPNATRGVTRLVRRRQPVPGRAVYALRFLPATASSPPPPPPPPAPPALCAAYAAASFSMHSFDARA